MSNEYEKKCLRLNIDVSEIKQKQSITVYIKYSFYGLYSLNSFIRNDVWKTANAFLKASLNSTSASILDQSFVCKSSRSHNVVMVLYLCSVCGYSLRLHQRENARDLSLLFNMCLIN